MGPVFGALHLAILISAIWIGWREARCVGGALNAKNLRNNVFRGFSLLIPYVFGTFASLLYVNFLRMAVNTEGLGMEPIDLGRELFRALLPSIIGAALSVLIAILHFVGLQCSKRGRSRRAS